MTEGVIGPRSSAEETRWATGGELKRTHAEVTALLASRLGDIRPDAARKILLAAIAAFATSGYAGTTTRDIAALAGLSPAALYVHFRSKEEVLYRISTFGHQLSRGSLDRGLGAPAAGPPERLVHLVQEIATGFARQHILSRVVHNELWALTPEHFAEVAAMRRGFKDDVRDVVVAGVNSGDFNTTDPAGAAHAVLSLCVDLGRWYRSEGAYTPEDIGRRYADLALRIAGAPTGG